MFQVLQSFKIMDYSLLVGIHNLDRPKDETSTSVPDQKRPQGQKPLYCTAMEAIHGEVNDPDTLESSERLDIIFITLPSLCI